MTQKPWLVFGLDGRTSEDIADAVRLGYRRFDAAESYGTTDALANAVSGLERGDYEVLYKFDLRCSTSST
ncbi:hypothetical protein [Streptomyces sp. NPDC058086]|uniref:hypothetical protein n=1 Tax=Streptomyces sp. NPDC058086 TaxID=3346334 RepID=UPI0036F0782B